MRTRRYSPEPFKSRCVTLTLTLGDLWGPTPFLPPLIGLSFQGPQTSPTPALHQLSLAGEGAVSRWLRDKGRGPSAVLDPLLEACAHCASTPAPAGSASLGLGARGQPRRRPRAASPAAPRKPQRCPAPRPASWKLRSQDPPSNGAAGNWPLDFLRPDPDWDRPVGGAAKLGLPPSCFRLGGELRVGVRVQGPGRDVGRAGGGCGGSFALVPSRGGHGAGGRMVWRGRPRKPRRSPLCEPRRARTHQGRGAAERGPQGPLAGSGSEGRMNKGKRKEGTEVRMAVECCVTYNFRRGSGPERRTGGLWLWTITTFFVLMAKTLL